MRRVALCFLILSSILVFSCSKKETKKDTAINLVKAEYGEVRLNFDSAKLDSLYTISPAAYADSLKKGEKLDEQLAALEGEIEHLPQSSSDSVGRISAKLTNQRYKLLKMEKIKPAFIGWKLSNVRVKGKKQNVLDFNFDKPIKKIVK